MVNTVDNLKIKVWDAHFVVNKILDIVVHCVGYIYERGGSLPAEPEAEIIYFGSAVALCVNMFDSKKRGKPQRPRLEIDNVIFIFDNGINPNTNLDNHPCLYISGIPIGEVQPFESDDIEVRFSRGAVSVTFKGEIYLYGDGWSVVSSALPEKTVTKELIPQI